MVNVALVKSRDRYAAVMKALELIRADIKLPDRPVLIKPNMVSTKQWAISVTDKDAVIATMDFLKGLGVKKFIVGDGPGLGSPLEPVLKISGYLDLKKRFDVQFVDLNSDKPVEVTLFDSQFGPKKYQIAKTVADSYRVSVSRMKTHDTVIVTLAVKNTVIGCLLGAANKPAMHTGYPSMNLSMARLATIVPNDISIIDGVVGMEGNGPCDGTAINSDVVVASANQVACDSVGAELMGFNPDDVGYLYYLRQLQDISKRNIRVLGDRVEACITKYKPHNTYKEQLNWRVPNWHGLLVLKAA